MLNFTGYMVEVDRITLTAMYAIEILKPEMFVYV